MGRRRYDSCAQITTFRATALNRMSTTESSSKTSLPSASSTPRSEHQKTRWLVAVALSRARLARSTLCRVGFISGMSLAAAMATVGILVRAFDGASFPLDGLIDTSAASISVVAAGPTMLAAATDRRTADREGGIEALVAMRGIHASQLDLVRAYAAMLQIARTTALPLVTLALTLAALASTASIALHRMGIALGLAAFAIVVGVALGSVATLSARVGGRRGKLTVSAIVLLPWLVGELFDRGTYSIPGALSALLSLILDVGAGA